MRQSVVTIGQLASGTISQVFDAKIARPSNVPSRQME